MHRIRTPARFRADTSGHNEGRRTSAFSRNPSAPSTCADAPRAAMRLHLLAAMANEDSVWKEMLEGYFEEFLGFFFPHIHRDIDWSQGYECLKEELEPILRDGPLRERRVDLLVKVFRRDGGEAWILIHVEVQGYYEKEFEERVLVCNHRVRERYRREVVSLAVLTDDRPSWRPNEFRLERWDFAHVLRFPMVKLLDYRTKRAELESDPNPFALVVMAHLETQAAATDAERLQAKLGLIRRLYQRGYGRDDIIHLFRFIDWLLVLPADLEPETERVIAELEGVATMPYVTSIERRAKEEGRKEGEEKGKAEGLKEGLKEGLREGLLEAIELGLELRFGKAALQVVPRVREVADVSRLRELKAALTRVGSIGEFESVLAGR